MSKLLIQSKKSLNWFLIILEPVQVI